MKYIILPCIILVTFGQCTQVDDKSSQLQISVSDIDQCPEYEDTIFWGMEPISEETSEYAFVDLRKCFAGIKDDSLSIEIETRSIPDSSIYNNPLISRGYAEYALSIVFRNISDTSHINNIVFSIAFENFDKEPGSIHTSFSEFINACNKSIYLEQEKQKQEGVINFFHDNPIENLDQTRWTVDSSRIIIKVPQNLLCDYYEDHFSHGFFVKTCYNASTTSGVNNYITCKLSSDSWVRHNFVYNSARRLE